MELLGYSGSKPSFGEQLASFVADAAVGFLAIVAVFPICLFIPGAFMTWEPAAVVTVAMLFSAGLLRGASPPRNRWLKAARIEFGALIWAVACLALANKWRFIAIVAPSLVIPTVAGVSLRGTKGSSVLSGVR
jgi:hypothetical protein